MSRLRGNAMCWMLLLACFAGPRSARAQATPSRPDPGRNPVVWAAIGGGIGFGGGLLVGLRLFDDAVYAERKILITAIGAAAAGTVAGALLSRRAGAPTTAGAAHDPLWNGMVIGAAGGAAIGIWYIPHSSCETEVNPECPSRLRLAFGIPAIAGGAALGALFDRMRRPGGGPAPRPSAKPYTLVAPVFTPGAIGIVLSRSF